ncbi:MAG TPA: divergent polysaccharide deacetylase family protein [Geminicoccus sp.]|uniref:divergent polysaccharide deacetylase family protein n=1 Tax=Geminicoccus sp. TaxID=2024832 RepID=UPI002BDC41BB|nr:divergent polysaccharide deacetylase family protein [Geminicoccus sp.]HWL70995.1 divergent polysaccharide deacetylase family protein [Geminicoccus sp.]
MKLPSLSKTRNWLKRSLPAIAWGATIAATAVGFVVLTAWDDARWKSDWQRAVHSERPPVLVQQTIPMQQAALMREAGPMPDAVPTRPAGSLVEQAPTLREVPDPAEFLAARPAPVAAPGTAVMATATPPAAEPPAAPVPPLLATDAPRLAAAPPAAPPPVAAAVPAAPEPAEPVVVATAPAAPPAEIAAEAVQAGTAPAEAAPVEIVRPEPAPADAVPAQAGPLLAALAPAAGPEPLIPAPPVPSPLVREPVEPEIQPDAATEQAAQPAPAFEEPDAQPVAPVADPEPLPATESKRRQLMPERLRGPTIAIVIDDLGYNRKVVRRLIESGQALTLSFLPSGPEVVPSVRDAAHAGLDVLLHMPMEATGSANPGPGAIRVSMSDAEIRAAVDKAVAAVPGAVGMNNHMGSRATAAPKTMQPVMAALADHDMFFLDSRTVGHSKAQAVALGTGVPAIGRDVFLDNEPTIAAVTRQLQLLERRARAHGYAVAIGHPHRETVDALMTWLPEAEARGVRLVPLSKLVPVDTCRNDAATAFDCAAPDSDERLAAKALAN